MEFKVRQAVMNDIYPIGYVHYKSWLETYRGIVDDEYLDNLTLDSRIEKVHLYIDRCFVAEVDNRVIGFAAYIDTPNDEEENTLEVSAIYVLKNYLNFGIGKSLIRECINANPEKDRLSLWVSVLNKNAIIAYEKIGFYREGKEELYKIGSSTIKVLKMSKDLLDWLP